MSIWNRNDVQCSAQNGMNDRLKREIWYSFPYSCFYVILYFNTLYLGQIVTKKYKKRT